MLTQTLPLQESGRIITPENIQQTVDERGFYLYEWISSDELRMTLERDYLNIVKSASIPLAIVTAIAGFIGFSGGIIGTILAVIGVLGVFYCIIGVILAIKFLYRSYLYTRGANVVITDDHYVSWGSIIEQTDKKMVREKFSQFEEIFDEPFLWESKLADKKEKAKTELFMSLKEVASGGWSILENFGRWRDSGGIILVILVAGFLYAAMMGIIYFIGIFFISLFGRLFSWLANRYLLMMSNTEHRIQTLFADINESSDNLRIGQQTCVSLLSEASQNEWQENLSGKLGESFQLIGRLAGDATDNTLELRKLLESSEYKDIFNFVKYGNWIKKQILEPIESILLLLAKNRDTLNKAISSLDSQITETVEVSLQKPLILQKQRLEMQIESFEKNIEMLEGYKNKLI